MVQFVNHVQKSLFDSLRLIESYYMGDKVSHISFVVHQELGNENKINHVIDRLVAFITGRKFAKRFSKFINSYNLC